MPLPVKVELEPDHADAATGDRLEVDVTMRNASDFVEHYVVELLGLPDGVQVTTQPEVTKLMPRATGTATVRLTMPAEPPPRAGEYVVGVLVRSMYRPEVSCCEELDLVVAPVRQLTVKPSPELAHGRSGAEFALTVRNDGNTHVNLLLAASDPERRVQATFEPTSGGVAP